MQDPHKDLRRDTFSGARDPFRNGDRPVTEQDVIPGYRREAAAQKPNGRWEVERPSDFGGRSSNWSRGDSTEGKDRWGSSKDSNPSGQGSVAWNRDAGAGKPEPSGSVRWHRQDSGTKERWGANEPRNAGDRWGKPREDAPTRKPSNSWQPETSISERTRVSDDRELVYGTAWNMFAQET